MVTGRGIAIGLTAVLVALAIFVEIELALVLKEDAPKLTQPATAYGWGITAGLLAAGFCIVTVWRLRRVWMGSRGLRSTLILYPAAILVLIGVFFLAGLIALGSSD
jgi:hypothetical protein